MNRTHRTCCELGPTLRVLRCAAIGLPMLMAATAPNAAESCAASSARQFAEGQVAALLTRFEQHDGSTQAGLEELMRLAGKVTDGRQTMQPLLGVHQRYSVRSSGLPGDYSSTVSRFTATTKAFGEVQLQLDFKPGAACTLLAIHLDVQPR